VLALAARLLGAKVIVEFHETQDTGEARIRLAHAYVEAVRPLLMRLASGFVVHSNYDLQILKTKSGFTDQPITVIPLGPFDHGCPLRTDQSDRAGDSSCCNLLFFGVIRPFKGLEDLITAFNLIPKDQISNYRLTIVGETWEGWTIPEELITESPYKDRITFANRYVTDEELAAFLAAADAVVLPYHRSSASGPLHTAMSWGLPVVITNVGGLPEAVANYEGALLIPPKDPTALRRALTEVSTMRGRRFADSQSWERTVTLYTAMFSTLADGPLEVKDAPLCQVDRD
jgi:glycosyltransferase involved in cell wall biosynthesis